MNNKDFSMLIIAVLFVLFASSGMSMVTQSSTLSAETSAVIKVPWEYEYDNGDFFGSSTNARILLEEQWTGGKYEIIESLSVSDGQTYTGSFNYQVPDIEGYYDVEVRVEEWSGDSWVTAGRFFLRLTTTLPEYVEPDDPIVLPVVDPPADDGTDSGIVDDDTPIDQEVEAAILGDSLTDKIRLLWDLIVAFFEGLIGGTK